MDEKRVSQAVEKGKRGRMREEHAAKKKKGVGDIDGMGGRSRASQRNLKR